MTLFNIIFGQMTNIKLRKVLLDREYTLVYNINEFGSNT